jgi:prophage regulatory protein
MYNLEDAMKAPYWRPKTVASALGITISTLYNWLKDGKFPKPIQLTPHCVVWSREAVLKAISAKESANDNS